MNKNLIQNFREIQFKKLEKVFSIIILNDFHLIAISYENKPSNKGT